MEVPLTRYACACGVWVWVRCVVKLGGAWLEHDVFVLP